METEAYIETHTWEGFVLVITVKLHIYKDETNDFGRGSKDFWAYDIRKIKGVIAKYGEVHDIEINEDEYQDEIKKACDEELQSYARAA